MIDPLPPDLLTNLAAAGSGTHISLYLPTHRAGPGRDQDPIRFENLVNFAHGELVAGGLRPPEADDRLAPASALLDDPRFWAELGDGLAVFLSPAEMSSHRLPGEVEELAIVSDHHHVTPLVPFLFPDGVFYVLALGQESVELLRASRHQVTAVELAGAPATREEALRHDDRERQLHLHGSGRAGGGRVTAGFHGHADDKDLANTDLGRFFRIVDEGVARTIGAPPCPLVLAGTDRLVGMYRRSSHYPEIVDEALTRSTNGMAAEELRDRAWPLVADRFENALHRTVASASAGVQPTTADVPTAVLAASEGRVAALVVAERAHRWGTVDLDDREVRESIERRRGDEDLLDTVAVHTLRNRGEVFVVDQSEVPGTGPLMAVLRY